MLGALFGDIVGSIYEYNNIKSKEFPLFSPNAQITDDSILTIAVADYCLHGGDLVHVLQTYGKNYPDADYGGHFRSWLFSQDPQPYSSWGNGSAMRVSPVGFLFNNEEEVLTQAAHTASVTHNHPEGIKGAQATALGIYLARTGHSKEKIKTTIENRFGYDLSQTVDQIRSTYRYDLSCQGTVPPAIIAFLESMDFEDAIRNAISLGGDSDTLACITGGIAEAYYGLSSEIEEYICTKLDFELKQIVKKFKTRIKS